MTVCANRTDDPGFFIPCAFALKGPCKCGQDVAADLAAQAETDTTTEETP